MSDRNVTVTMNVGTPASGGVKALADDTRNLALEETRYQEKVQSRVKALAEHTRMQADLVKLGALPAATGEEKYQQILNASIKSLETRKRLQEDLIRMGMVEGPKPPPLPKTLGERADEYAKRTADAKAFDEELIRRGLKEAPKPPAPP